MSQSRDPSQPSLKQRIEQSKSKDPSTPSLRQRTDQLINLDPKEKQKRLKQWMVTKEQEVKTRFKEQKAKRDKKRREEREEEMLKKEALQKWRERKLEEERIEQEEEQQRELELRKEDEDKMKIQVASKNMYRRWLMLKQQADNERKEQQKLRHQEFLVEIEKRRELGERAFREWLKETRANAAETRGRAFTRR